MKKTPPSANKLLELSLCELLQEGADCGHLQLNKSLLREFR